MLGHMIKIVKHIRPEIVFKWVAAGIAGMLCMITYDYTTKGDDIFFEDGEYDWLINGSTETRNQDDSKYECYYAGSRDEPYLKLKVEE